jgi:hypothetical protein
MTSAAINPDEIDQTLDRILAPFERWADVGYAEGVVDYLPSLARIPILLTPGSVVKIFDAAFAGLDMDDREAKDEAERRTDFVERLMDRLMTRETGIRDRYYTCRNRGMIHRTLVLIAGIGVFTAIAVTLPAWIYAPVGLSMAVAGAFAHRRFERERKTPVLPKDRCSQIIDELPWIKATAESEPV